MRRDRNHDDLTLPGPVVPEDPIDCRRLALGVGCKDLFAARTFQTFILVGVETRMAEIGFHEAEGLSYRLQALLQALVSLKRIELLTCGRRECQRESRHAQPLINLFAGVLGKRADLTCLAASGFFCASAHALQCGLIFIEPGFMKGNGDFRREQNLA